MGNFVSSNQPPPRELSRHSCQTRPKEVVASVPDNTQRRDVSNQSTGDYPEGTYSTCGDTNSVSSHPEDTFPWPTIADGHFVNTQTLQAEPSSNQNGPRVRARNVFPQDHGNRSLSFEQLYKKWKSASHPRYRNDVILHILNIRIPYLESEKRYLETAVFLKINDESICKRVKESLMKCLLRCDDEVDVSQILDAEIHVWRRLRQHEDLVFDLGLTYLLLWCCLLCNTDVTMELEDRICELSKERRASIQEFRHEVQSTASSDLFKALQSFHDDFPRRFAKRSVLSWGKDVRNTSRKMDEETLNLVKKAKFCDKVLHLFSLFKQIFASGNDCERILAYLKYILPSLLNGQTDEKETQSLAVLLTKGCVFALQTAFHQADVQVGGKENPTKRQLIQVIESVLDEQAKKKISIGSILNFVKNSIDKKLSSYNRSQYILDELSPLIFHPAKSVRNQAYKLFSRFQHDFMGTLTRREIERGQSNCRLKIASHTDKKGKYFQTFKGEMGNQPVIIYANVPSFDNLSASGNNVPDSDETQTWDKDRHINNFNMQRSIPSHVNIGWLLGYQVKPFLMYYIIEDSRRTTLLEHVLERRERNNWIVEKELLTILSDIVSGLSALHQHNIILRDLTLSNFFLDHDKVKIGDLSLACQHRAKNNMPVKDPYARNLAVRWLSPEALKDGSFSPQSDVWSLGHLIYTLWTHGCEPYTEFPDSTTDDIMAKVVLGDVIPFQWPCMSQPIYNLMCQCLKKDPRERIELETFMRELKAYTEELPDQDIYNDTQKVTFQEIKDRDKHYGAPNWQQKKRQNVPEKGIKFIQDHRRALQESNEYSVPPKKKSGSQQPFLNGPSDLKMADVEGGVEVTEPMKEEFVTKILPQIEAAGFKPLKKFTHVLHEDGPGNFIEGTAYPESKTLLNLALDGSLSDCGSDCLIHLCYQVAKQMSDIHAKGWILRDLRAKNLLVNQRTLEVYLCRKGKMVQLPFTETGCEFIKDDKDALREAHRWLPAESVIDSIFSRPSDVAAWAYMVHEVLQAFSERNPKKCVPYHTSSDEELGMLKQSRDYLPQPRQCPDWLYTILLKCWNPDRNQRSHLGTVISELEDKLQKEIIKHNNRMAVLQDADACPKYEFHVASKQSKRFPFPSILRPKKKSNKQVSRNTVRSSRYYESDNQGYINPSFYEEENIYTTVVGYEPVNTQERRKRRKSYKQRPDGRKASWCSTSTQERNSPLTKSKNAVRRKRPGYPLPETPKGDRPDDRVELQDMKHVVNGEENRNRRTEISKRKVWERIGHEVQDKFCYENGRFEGETNDGSEAEGRGGGRDAQETQFEMQNRDCDLKFQSRPDIGVDLEFYTEEEDDNEKDIEGLMGTECTKPEPEHTLAVSLAEGQQPMLGEQRTGETVKLSPLQTKEERGVLDSPGNTRQECVQDKEGHIAVVRDEADIRSQGDESTKDSVGKEEAKCDDEKTSQEGQRLDENSNHLSTGFQRKSEYRPEKKGLENQEENIKITEGSGDQQTGIKDRVTTTENKHITLGEKRTVPIEYMSPREIICCGTLSVNQIEERQPDSQGHLLDERELRIEIGGYGSHRLTSDKDEEIPFDDEPLLPRQTAGSESRMFENGTKGRGVGKDQKCQIKVGKDDPMEGKQSNGHDIASVPRQMSLVLKNTQHDMQIEKESDPKCCAPENINTKNRSQSGSIKQTKGTEILSEPSKEDIDIEEYRQNGTTDKILSVFGKEKLENRDKMKVSQSQTKNNRMFQSLRETQTKTVEKGRDDKPHDKTPTTRDLDLDLGRIEDGSRRHAKTKEMDIEQGTGDTELGHFPSVRRGNSDWDSRMKRESERGRELIAEDEVPRLEPTEDQQSLEEDARGVPYGVPNLSVPQCKTLNNTDCRKRTLELGQIKEGNFAIRNSIANGSCKSSSPDTLSENQFDRTGNESEILFR